MSDPVGTVRREDHDGGYSVWQRVLTRCDGEYWLCTWSTSSGNTGCDWAWGFGPIEDATTVIGAVPGTPAAETDPLALSRDEVWQIVAEVRDASPRRVADADTYDIVNVLADCGLLRLAPTRVGGPMSAATPRPAIGEAEEVVLTLPAASGWSDHAGDGVSTPYWGTGWGSRTTAYIGGVELDDGDYREDLAEWRAEALAMLAAINAAERYQTKTAGTTGR